MLPDKPGPAVNHLRAALIGEIIDYLGGPGRGGFRALIELLLYLPADRFARLASDFDGHTESDGFRAASRWVLSTFGYQARVTGAETIPSDGPLLIAANHPGTFDAFAIAASLPRDDLKIISRGMPFLYALPSTSHSLIYSTRNVHEKMAAARAALRHLKRGGALLVFPTGTLDPDPACMPGARQALAAWSSSLELFLRKAPETQLQVALLSGFVTPRFLHHRLARSRKTPREQQIVAEILQVITQLLSRKKNEHCPKVCFPRPGITQELSVNNPVDVMERIYLNLMECQPGAVTPGRTTAQ